MRDVREVRTQLETVAEWIVDLRLDDVPEQVVSLAKAQILDTVAAICAGSTSAAGRRIRRSFERTRTHGPCSVIPDGEKLSVFDAAYIHAALANALELDSIVFLGHVCQSSVSVPLAVGELIDADGEALLTAQIAAVEVAGRMGAQLASGPQQGHMRAFLHRVAAATATSKLLGLSVRKTASALAIALSMPEYPLVPAAFSPDTKVLCTAAPTVEGIRAAYLAEAGLDAALDIFEHAAGLFRNFSYEPVLPRIWSRIGATWSLYALSSKYSAACAYAQGPVAATLEVKSSSDFPVDAVESIDIYAPLTTLVMESFSAPHLGAGITPVNTNFSTRRSVAAALLADELSGSQFEEEAFGRLAPKIEKLYHRTRLIHRRELTVDLIRGMDSGLEGAGRPGVLGTNQMYQTLKRFHRTIGSAPPPGFGAFLGLARLPAGDRNYLLSRYWRGFRARLPFAEGRSGRDRYVAFEKDLTRFSFRVAGRVVVRLLDGSELSAECRVPPGFAGDPSRREAMASKYDREAVRVLGEGRARALREEIDRLPAGTARQLLSGLAGGGGGLP